LVERRRALSNPQRDLQIGSDAGVTMSLGLAKHRDGSDGPLLIYAISIAAIAPALRACLEDGPDLLWGHEE